MPELKQIVYIGIALAILYILTTTIIMPQFANNYEYGFGTQPCSKTGCTSATGLTNPKCLTGSATPIVCATCNTTTGYSTFLSSCSSLIAWTNDTHCYQCNAFNSYNATNQGLLLFILVIGFISFGIVFFKYIKR